MKIVVVTVAKRRLLGIRGLPPAVERRITQALEHPPWGSAGTTRRDSWTSGSGVVRIDVVTNEPSTSPLVVRHSGGRAVAWTGYIDDLAFKGADPDPSAVADLPGCFALVAGTDSHATGFTAVHRMEPLYLAEGKHALILCNSARIAHQVAGQPNTGPPLAALIGISGPGFMLNDQTPFPGVEAVPAESFVTVTASGARVRSLPPPDIDPDTPLELVVDQVTEALATSAANIGRVPWKRTVQITGGKDSRLAAAVLSAAGVDYISTTTGVPSHPDVVIARHVAHELHVAHQVKPPVGTVLEGDAVEVRPVQRAYSVLRGCEGMLSAYESIGLLGPYREGTVSLGGHGGELLRGGFTYGVPPATDAQVRRRLDGRIGPHRHLLTKNAQAELDRIAGPWRELVTSDPHGGSERFYRVVRTGRWHAVANSVYSIGGPRRSLLADNRVVRIVSAARQELAAEERIVHAVIHRLRPDLCALPLYPKRWNFERTGPSADCDPDGWAHRAPPGGGKRQAWNWKVTYPAELHHHFTDVILAAPLYADLLDRTQVERFLAETCEERTSPQASLIWSLYTASQLVAGLGSSPNVPDGPMIRIPIPGN